MVTSTMPAVAAPYCSSSHCGRFVAQMPTCSPGRMSSASSPFATSRAGRVELRVAHAHAGLREDDGIALRYAPGGARQHLADGQPVDPRFFQGSHGDLLSV
ncbi:MAG: hypothetical protein WDN72_03595 [Alphaproteobacteria bacterium]